MVRGAIRALESALGDGVKRPMPSEADTRRVARKSLVARALSRRAHSGGRPREQSGPARAFPPPTARVLGLPRS